MELEQIKKIVEERLSKKRFYHSECVMERAKQLAERFGINEEIAQKVAIAHDIAKEITPEEKIKYIEENKIEIDDMERQNTTLLHAKIGEDIAIKQFAFTKEMGQAIRAHTTGIPDMTLLDKIIFIADRTSTGREFVYIEHINNLLEESIDKAVLYVLDKKIQLQIEKKAQMHVDSIITRNWILKEGKI